MVMWMRVKSRSRFALYLTFPFYALAALVNVTVDSSGQDPITGRRISYTPNGNWLAGGPSCKHCLAHPDVGRLYGGTWYESIHGPHDFPDHVARFTFNGTAVYVICALARTATGLLGNSDMIFSINGTVMKYFPKPAPGTEGYDYNVTVFSAPSLPPGLHNLSITNGVTGGPVSLMLLDAIIYTFDDGSKKSSPTPVGAIAGGTIGGLAFLIAIILGLLWWRKRKPEQKKNIFQRFGFESTPAASRRAQVSSPILPTTTPTSDLNDSKRDYVDEPPIYELGDIKPSGRSGK